MTNNIAQDTATTARRRITTATKIILAAGAIAMSATTLGPATANADPNNNPSKPRTEKDIKQDCKDANGSYGTHVNDKGNRESHCDYFDSDGNEWIDNYTNGTYTGTSGPFRPKPASTPPPSAVILPPAANSIQ